MLDSSPAPSVLSQLLTMSSSLLLPRPSTHSRNPSCLPRVRSPQLPSIKPARSLALTCSSLYPSCQGGASTCDLDPIPSRLLEASFHEHPSFPGVPIHPLCSLTCPSIKHYAPVCTVLKMFPLSTFLFPSKFSTSFLCQFS